MNKVNYTTAAHCGSDIVRSIRDVASALADNEPTSQEFTRSITAELCKTIRRYGGTPLTEYRLELYRSSRGGGEYAGHLDIYSEFKDRSRIAIEIDRGNKLWSMRKLEFSSTSLGATALWVRWRGTIKIRPADPVLVIDLTDIGQRIRRSQTVTPDVLGA